jgi:hypothetical protein
MTKEEENIAMIQGALAVWGKNWSVQEYWVFLLEPI